jgi:acetoin utilization protein AcuC
VACRAALIYSEDYLGYRLSATHPLKPIRLALTDSLVEAAGLLEPAGVSRLAPRAASVDELLLAHSLPYVRRVQELSSDGQQAEPWSDFGLGTLDNPVFPRMHEVSALVVGGTIQAAEMIMDGTVEHAFNIGGGLHHANRSLASGFCVYNDAAVGVAWFHERGLRVLYVDTDAHHGDGVQSIFYENPDVLTISMHESGRFLFPGTGEPSERGSGAGEGFSINVPLQPYTDHASWVECYDLVVPPLARAFRPDVVVAQSGCDGHAVDPLTHLNALTPTYEHFARRAHELSHELCEGRLLALGGGGYALWDVVPRAWTAVWAAITDQRLPEAVPADWREQWEARIPDELPTLMHDGLDRCPPTPRQDIISAENRRVARMVAERGIPPRYV